MKDILPIGEHYNASTVRNHLCQIAKRQEAELENYPAFLYGCPREWGALPKPRKPIVVGIDGCYFRDRNNKKHNFEVIAGKSYSAEAPTKRFSFVQRIENVVVK